MKKPPCSLYEPPKHIEVKSKLNKIFCRKMRESKQLQEENLLEKNGYITISIYEQESLKTLRQEFLNECKNFQEFKSTPSNEFILGGFGALGNPSSFHNLFVRKVRKDVYKNALKTFKTLYKNKNIECLFDRMLLRTKGNAPSRETWHRDITPNLKKNDKMFGGWLNLDDTEQYFSCVPGTHEVTEEDMKTKGFAQIKKDSSKFKELSEKKIKVSIPPGHCIIFYQHIIHEVLSTKLKYDLYRVFNSFRITDDIEPVFDIKSVIENQGVPRLPSNQIPPMYAKLHWTNWADKIQNWSSRIHDKCIEEKYMKSKNKSYKVIHQHMNSLNEYGFKLYPKYSKSELDMFSPNKL